MILACWICRFSLVHHYFCWYERMNPYNVYRRSSIYWLYHRLWSISDMFNLLRYFVVCSICSTQYLTLQDLFNWTLIVFCVWDSVSSMASIVSVGLSFILALTLLAELFFLWWIICYDFSALSWDLWQCHLLFCDTYITEVQLLYHLLVFFYCSLNLQP